MALFSGKTWFRNNIMPYLTKIKAEIAASGGTPPLVTTSTPPNFNINTVTAVSVTGDFFTPTMTATCPTATITNYTFISQQSCTFDILTSTAQTNTITLTTVGGSTTLSVTSLASAWVDLRTGGSVYTETHRTGTTITQDADGLRSSGILWSNWLKITSVSWQRVNLKRVSIIYRGDNSACMVGIMGSDQIESSTAQYYQAEIYAYNTGSAIARFYGTNAAHTGVSSAITSTTTSGNTYIKLVYSNNGNNTGTMKIYGLSNLSNLDDVSNLLNTITIPAVFTADSVTLYPCVTFGSTSQRLVAVKVEDM